MKHLIVSLLLLITLNVFAQLKSPGEFLPEYGKHVTYYHQLETYFEQLQQNTDMMQHMVYGQTYEGRNLHAYIISTAENLKDIDNIRKYHLQQAGLETGTAGIATAPKGNKAIVWLSFNVHGNEPAAAESAMNVAYELINPANTQTKEWLKDIVIILDPCLNPDGFARYGNWLHSVTGHGLHAGTADREHMEPWPGGRENHYAYDLNRDWAWQVQKESRHRIALYNQWMPMVHVDVHEMGYNEPYFFPPAAEPMHDFITRAQKDFHTAIGEVTAKKFDEKGWSYYTREVFDLFYPSYGDTYPTFNGAVGMTYEQGGIGAGRAVERDNGTVLTLQDRINHHSTAILAAVETAAWQREKLIKNFRVYFKDALDNPKGKYETYIVKAGGKASELADLLSRNNIAFTYADEAKKLSGYHYQSDKDKDFSIEPNDIIIKAKQPKSVLAQVFFEPVQRLSDSLSYDITAWALPHAFGVESYALKRDISIKTKALPTYKGKLEVDRVYAFYVPWNGRQSVRVLAQLHKNKVRVRSARKASFYRGINIKEGDLVILKGDNVHIDNFEQTIKILLEGKPDYEAIESGFSLTGADLGSESYPLLEAPRVLLLSGRGVNTTDFGQAWFYFDDMVSYPVSVVDVANLGRISFGEFTTIILAEGWYDLTDAQKARIDSFIDGGGKVIAIGAALDVFNDRAGYSLTKFATPGSRTADEEATDAEALDARFYNYESYVRRELSSSVSGAIVENVLDKSHPLSYGLGDKYFSLKTSATYYQLLKGASNVAYVPQGYKSFGFIGSNLKKKLGNTVTFAVEQKGRGSIIYMADNPLFRGFWENGNLLFANAVFLVD
jgi:hypothetical protein